MRIIRILQETEVNAKVSKQSRLYLEIALIKMCKIEYDTSNEVILTRLNKMEQSIKEGKIKVEVSKETKDDISWENNDKKIQKKEIKNIETKKEEVVVNENSKLTIDDIGRKWTEVLEVFKAKRAMIIQASLLTGKPYSFNKGILTIEFDELYSQSKPRLENPNYSKVVNEVFSEMFKEKIIVRYVIRHEEVSYNKEEILKEKLNGEIPFEVYNE